MSAKMTEEGAPTIISSIKAMRKLATMVRSNFFKTIEINQRLAAILKI